MIISKKNLLYTLGRETPVPPVPVGGHQLLYLMNGNNSSNTKLRNWSIDTGITWRDVFVNSSSLGLEYPGLETVLVYAYSYVPPEGGLVAGNNPRYNQAGGGGSRDMGGFWRIFGHGNTNHFCFDCPSEDDRLQVPGTMVPNRIYTETAKYGYLGTSTLRSYLKIEYENTLQGENYLTPRYTWSQAHLPHNLYLWSDNSQTTGDTAPRGGVKIYSFTVYSLENGERVEKLYEGLPWMDTQDVPCIKDTVSNTLQYNCSSDPQPFLYGEIE